MRFSCSPSLRRLGPVLVVLSLAFVAACGSGDDTGAADGDAAQSTDGQSTDGQSTDGQSADTEPVDTSQSTDADSPTDDVAADSDDQATADSDSDGDGDSDSDGDSDGDGAAEDGELFPDVLDATASLSDDGTWSFSATLSSPYETPERYADAWRVVGPDGEVYGIRELAHDHASEQPFTRSQSGIEIPEDVTVVTVEGRDQVSGWGGATVDVALER